MLPRAKRLPKEFLKSPRGRRATFPFGSLLFLSETKNPRVAVVVSKKICPKALERNRLRRRMYHAIQNALRDGALATDMVVYPTRVALTAPFSELESAFRQTLER